MTKRRCGGVHYNERTRAQHIRPRMNVPPRFTYNWWHFNLNQEHNNKMRPFMETWQTAYRPLCLLCFFAGPLISRRSALGSFVFNAIRLCIGYLYYSCICISYNNNNNNKTNYLNAFKWISFYRQSDDLGNFRVCAAESQYRATHWKRSVIFFLFKII